jgi:hypothetical protein
MTERPFSPAADRNKQPVLDTLRTILGPRGNALEIASGTGQHAAWFAAALSQWVWQPTDADAEMLPALADRVAQSGLPNLLPPLLLDVTASRWPSSTQDFVQPRFDVVYCANMLHIAPLAAGVGLMAGAARHLATDGLLITYGPYFEEGTRAAPGNLAFDESLRSRDPSWGIRHLNDVTAQARHSALVLRERHAMPANNLLLVFGF